MRWFFPYKDVPPVDVPDGNLKGVYRSRQAPDGVDPAGLTAAAISVPIGTAPLRQLAAGKKRILIVADDISRPTPVHLILPPVLAALGEAGVPAGSIEFMMALGSHRHMTRAEMERKLGQDVVRAHAVHNHDWNDRNACVLLGKTEQGVEVWINRKVAEADLVIGVGRIMPIDICGFTGGGKILVPGVCGKITNDDMHWTRMDLDDAAIVGQRDNPVRASIDALARKAGLGFIINCVMDTDRRVAHVVAGDLEKAHRRGCELALGIHGVRIPEPADIVIADSYPFDIEFWQANKALDQAGVVVKKGGVLILVSPCSEGFSATHCEILEFGYPPIEEIKRLVRDGRIPSKVVGVHMAQVSRVAREKAHVILVTSGIPRQDVEKAGLGYAETPQAALDAAFDRLGRSAGVAILRGAAEMLPVVGIPPPRV
jgi:nickel-dependent lactate racemase